MTKSEVLAILANARRPLQPMKSAGGCARAWYTWSGDPYLLRLARQGLLKRAHAEWGRLSYVLTPRGHARLEYFRAKNPRRSVTF